MKKVEAQEINCKDCIDFRTLVYGNSFNLRTKTAFGSDTEYGGDPTGSYKVLEDGIYKTLSFTTKDEFSRWLSKNQSAIRPNDKACNKDFGLRVEGMPELTDEEVNMTCAKLTKQSMF